MKVRIVLRHFIYTLVYTDRVKIRSLKIMNVNEKFLKPPTYWYISQMYDTNNTLIYCYILYNSSLTYHNVQNTHNQYHHICQYVCNTIMVIEKSNSGRK